jgi:DNA-binding response OmpR family regulator
VAQSRDGWGHTKSAGKLIEEKPMTTGMDLQNKSILVVDDDESVRKLIQITLRRQGHRCTTAANSQEARQLLDGEPFALLLSDIHMPGESGLDLVAHVKSAYEDMAVIIITVIDDIETAQRALSLDIYGYMVKPVDKNQIVIGVANALRRRELELKHKNQSRELEEQINHRTRELSETVEKLKARESELAAKMEELHELNTALKVLLNNRETDRVTLEENIQSNVKKLILPCIERLKKAPSRASGSKASSSCWKPASMTLWRRLPGRSHQIILALHQMKSRSPC